MAEGPLEVAYLRACPHIRQHFAWDCGLACSRMILAY